jgi:hypothetical protein
MNIDELTIGEARQIAKALQTQPTKSPCVWQVGKAYLIRCVTHYQIGTLREVTTHELLLADAGWCADTGRYEESLRTGSLKEFEPVPGGEMIVGRGAIVDAAIWVHRNPKGVIG